MALGIAAVAILASLTYGVLLKPLPWASSPRLVRLYENRQGSTGRFRPMMTNGTYLVWRDAMKTLDAVAAWSGDRLTVTGTADPERLTVGEITPSLLPLLGASPLLGRGFLPGEEDEGRPAIAILSHGLWLRRFGGRPDVVGGTLHLDGRSVHDRRRDARVIRVSGPRDASVDSDGDSAGHLTESSGNLLALAVPGDRSPGTRRHAGAGRH